MFRIESLLSARLFMAPQLTNNRVYFLSNLSGHLSLYAMDYGGSVPEPLLPPQVALQNPHLIGGYSFFVFPKRNVILVMIDRDGDEIYQPTLIPIQGGFPEPAFQSSLAESRVHLISCDIENNLVYLLAESLTEPIQHTYRGDLVTGELTDLGSSPFGLLPAPESQEHHRVALLEGYTVGDTALYEWTEGQPGKRLLFGVPYEQRQPGQEIPLNGMTALEYSGKNGLLILSALIEDTYSFGFLNLEAPTEIRPVEITGKVHTGWGETVTFSHLDENRYAVEYNIDGVSWLYEAEFDRGQYRLNLTYVLCGQAELSNGVLEHFYYDRASDRFVLAFSTATSPTQIYTVEGKDRSLVVRHTNERVLGIEQELLSPGEDASFVSYDGIRVSARLYLPSVKLGFKGPRPVVYYVHGGPQGQERPDFAWFSMPLIQYLTLNGFAVFVPNVRGSTGYGLSYTKQVDRDWGGRDRQDHVFAMNLLLKDPRLDARRAGVVGRSYGGYMTLTLAGRHSDLWKAAVDMFGPFDLITFSQRIPETWKPYFQVALGDVETDRDFLVERSPRTYIDQLTCPMLVIQGRNDPRVVEPESNDLVTHLRQIGKRVDYLVFENEGHDVLKFENRVRCYNDITEFFMQYLIP
jgi:pimeloyl-ACP methyl ester carboxylesterase